MIINRTLLLLAIVSTGLSASTVFAAAPAQSGTKLNIQQSTQAALTPAQRGEMTRQFVRKWGAYVQQVYNAPVGVWANRMVPTFVGADASNFRRALLRNTYEGASAELSGTGSKLSDEQVIDSMARASLVPAGLGSQMVTKSLGAAASDLVYTPITPCRILDTRIAGGAIAGNFSRDFNAVVGSGGNFSSQGGSATDCGGVAAGQAAAVINVTAVTPAGAGFATVYPFGAARPLASSVNYTAGDIVNNTVVTKLPNPLTTKDFSIYSFATSDFVADIVGYYSPPQATALDCTTVSGANTSVPAGAYTSLPTLFCAATYTPVALSIAAGENVVVADSYTAGNAGQIFVRSLSVNAQTVNAKLMCCRVPGR
jgi:hypothetical protein